jgi:hypothetical protein
MGIPLHSMEKDVLQRTGFSDAQKFIKINLISQELALDFP